MRPFRPLVVAVAVTILGCGAAMPRKAQTVAVPTGRVAQSSPEGPKHTRCKVFTREDAGGAQESRTQELVIVEEGGRQVELRGVSEEGGIHITRAYDAAGALVAEQHHDKAGRRETRLMTKWHRDPQGRVLRVERVEEQSESTEPPRRRVWEVKFPRRDAQGRWLSSESRSEGRVVRTETRMLDALGRTTETRASTVDAGGEGAREVVTRFSYASDLRSPRTENEVVLQGEGRPYERRVGTFDEGGRLIRAELYLRANSTPNTIWLLSHDDAGRVVAERTEDGSRRKAHTYQGDCPAGLIDLLAASTSDVGER